MTINQGSKTFTFVISAESEDFPKGETRYYKVKEDEIEKAILIGFEIAREFPQTNLRDIRCLVCTGNNRDNNGETKK